MKKILLTTLLFFATLGAAFADEVSFIASAPKSVVVDKRFQLSFEVNSNADSQPVLPDIEGMTVLFGPAISTSMSTRNINGQVTMKQATTYTYTVVANAEGEINIPEASIMVDGKKYTSNPIIIKVLPPDQAAAASSQGSDPRSSRRRGSESSTEISADDLFMRATLSKTKVYEGEAVLLTYKVYSRVDLTALSNPAPDLHGFNIQEIELPQNKQFEIEHYNGRNYNTVVWRQYVLFPQQTGELEIPAMNYEATVAVQSYQDLDPFAMMFNGGYPYVEVKKTLYTGKRTINVQPLPSGKPTNFSGAVGKFTINSSVSTTELKANEEFTYKLIVKGSGNMRLMGDPVVNFPGEFDVFDPIISNNYRLTKQGFSGEKVYEYVVTPRTSGTFELPAAQFAYFDAASGTYKTIQATSYEVNVAKGSAPTLAGGNIYVVKEDGEILASDIRHIKLGANKKPSVGKLFGSSAYIMFYILPLALFIVAAYVNRKRIAFNANTTLVKTKKANSVAVRRLKNAQSLMRNNRSNEFYDEVLKAVWGYLSDKLNIPQSQLSKDNIANRLAARGVDENLITELTQLLNEGEFARFAPGDTGATMDKVYRNAISVISKMENSIKK